MRNMAFISDPVVAITKPSKKSTTRLYFGDMVKFFKEIREDFKRNKKYKKK